VTGGADGCVNVWAVDANDAVAGATLAAQIAQREASVRLYKLNHCTS
jgi:hypothetical protein